MHVTVWTYPWDVARLGARAVVDDLVAHGVQGIDLAATYHPISVLSPRGPHVRGMFSPRGAVHFPARPGRYGRITPAVSPDAEAVGAWPAVAALAADAGLELNAWTIGLFQPWMAQDHPHVARVYPTGDRVDAGVCPSNPDVRTYLAALAGDLADQFPIGLVKLEGVRNPAFDYGWIRRRIYFDLSAAQQRMLAVCFCDGCREMGRARGVDVESVRRAILDLLVIDQHAPAPSWADGGGEGASTDDAELLAYAEVARDAAAALVHEVAATLREVSPSTRVAVASPNEAGGVGVPVSDVMADVGTVLLMSVREGPERVAATAAAVQAHATPIDLEYMLHPPFQGTFGALPSGIDETLEDAIWRNDLRRAVELGVRRLSVYNYGLLRQSTFTKLVQIAQSP